MCPQSIPQPGRQTSGTDSLFSFRKRGVRVKRDCGRSWGFIDWSPLVIDFGYLRFNRWWWHNLHCRLPLVFRLHHGEWPTYYWWDKRRKAREHQDSFPPDCADGDCKKCYPCYSAYVEAKIAGELD